MFARIAARYDFLNHGLSGGLDLLWRRRLVQAAGLARGQRVLDLAAGTLDVSLALARSCPGVGVLCLDVCRPMLERGRDKAVRKNMAARLLAVQGDAFALPCADASLDRVTVAFGIRNMAPRDAVFREILRALRPGGRFAMLEFGSASRPVWGGAYNVYLRHILPRIGRLAGGDGSAYAYLARSIEAFPEAAALDAELLQAGFGRVRHQPLSGGIVYLHCADRPLGSEGDPGAHAAAAAV